MATRLTSDAVQVVSTGEHVMAMVTGRNGRVYVVDRNTAWSPAWMCTCGWAPDCAHIRETKKAIG